MSIEKFADTSNILQRSMSTSLLLWLLSTLFFLVAFCVLGKIRKLIELDNACQSGDSLITFEPIWKRISGEKWKRLATRKFIAGRYGLSGLISTRVNDDSKMFRRKGFQAFSLHTIFALSYFPCKVISTNQTRAYNVLQQPDFKSINFLSAEAFVTPAPEKLPLVDWL